MQQVTPQTLLERKRRRERMVMVTAYAYEMARIVARSEPDSILVGDSGAGYVLGRPDPTQATMDDMLVLTRAVTRAVQGPLVIGDMPFMSYQVSPAEAVRNAGRLVQEAGADAVKIECGEAYADTVAAVVRAGIPVVGHVGVTPLTSLAFGDYRTQDAGADQVRRDALALQAAGACALVLTRVSPPLAASLTAELRIPTFAGAGAGDACDGQVCVCHSVFRATGADVDEPGTLARAFFDRVDRFVQDVRAGKAVRSTREAGPAG